jgi:endonuclease G, mitochondrial
MKANLSQVATYESMQPLAIPGQAEGLLERAGREPTTHPEALADRQGYDPGFLDGWEILLPLATGPRKNDMRRVRRGGGGVELRYTHFSVLMSTSRRLPMLTAVNIDASQSRKVPRIQSWSFDGRLDEGDQFGDALYDGNDLDRGHMVRREDPVWGDEEEARLANEDTFHFTNSCPQMAQVNQQIWLGLENYILKHARVDKMRVSVFTGPFLEDDDMKYRSAKVPKAFWKVVGFVLDDGRPSATAYRVSQEEALSDLEFVFGAYKTFQISIKEVMDKTKIDFSALVPFDGFSARESVTGSRVATTLESPADIRV